MNETFFADAQNPPNAALEIFEASDGNDVVVVEISSPDYDEGAGTLKFDARLLDAVRSPGPNSPTTGNGPAPTLRPSSGGRRCSSTTPRTAPPRWARPSAFPGWSAPSSGGVRRLGLCLLRDLHRQRASARRLVQRRGMDLRSGERRGHLPVHQPRGTELHDSILTGLASYEDGPGTTGAAPLVSSPRNLERDDVGFGVAPQPALRHDQHPHSHPSGKAGELQTTIAPSACSTPHLRPGRARLLSLH